MVSFQAAYTGKQASIMSRSKTYFGLTPATLFQAFKYAVYLVIVYNVIYFVLEDHGAAAHRFRDGVSLSDITDAYAQGVDSLAWLILLLVFEIETWVLDDRKYKGLMKYSLNALSAVCYFFIVKAGLGYAQKLMFVLGFDPVSLATACDGVGTYLSYAIELDEFAALTTNSCTSVAAGPYLAHMGDSIIADTSTYDIMVLLGYVEVTNAFTWMAIVILLWIDVFLQMRGELTNRLYRINVWAKSALYFILFVCAIIWGIDGNFMDFWDAFIWIVAFFFIEMNIFQWHEETSHTKPTEPSDSNEKQEGVV